MLVPAIQYKSEIEKQFTSIQYTDKYMWYTGSIENFDIEVRTEGDKFAFAIIEPKYGELVGYVSFRVDWYCSMAYNFSLIKFKYKIYDEAENEYMRGRENINLPIGGFYIDTKPIMASAIREVIRLIEGFNLHRIDFRCIRGNPAERGYDGIIKKFSTWYSIRIVDFKDNIKDKQGKYHDTIMYELIRRDVGND